MSVVDQMYLDNLEEFVNDENKIVTYKWLSKTLTVHVNQAKQMLYAFVEKQRNVKDNDMLNVTYFISGLTEDNGEKVHRMQVIPEERLETSKQSFNPLTSCHIYSVQKCKIKDTAVLYMTDIDILKEQILHSNKYSAIKCTCAKLRSGDELVKLRTVAQPTTNAPSFTKDHSNGLMAQPNKNISNQVKKPAGIAGMFANAGKKKEDSTASNQKDSSKSTETNKKNENASKQKGKAGIANFFGNQASKPKQAPKETISGSKENKGEKSPVEVNKSPSPKPQIKSKSRKKVEDADDDDSVQQKKRRRIKAASWSDSSDNEEEDMEEEPLPEPSPPREPTPPLREPTPSPVKEPSPSPEKIADSNTSTSSSGKRRKRRKKLVSKTSVDNDGYMVTEKVWEEVSESASEAEDAIPPTPPVKQVKPADKKKKTPTKKNSPGKSGKQTSLMSFFKKK